jgi:hypothetical protein
MTKRTKKYLQRFFIMLLFILLICIFLHYLESLDRRQLMAQEVEEPTYGIDFSMGAGYSYMWETQWDNPWPVDFEPTLIMGEPEHKVTTDFLLFVPDHLLLDAALAENPLFASMTANYVWSPEGAWDVFGGVGLGAFPMEGTSYFGIPLQAGCSVRTTSQNKARFLIRGGWLPNKASSFLGFHVGYVGDVEEK